MVTYFGRDTRSFAAMQQGKLCTAAFASQRAEDPRLQREAKTRSGVSRPAAAAHRAGEGDEVPGEEPQRYCGFSAD
jgi:hypothetical protein